MQPNSPTEIPPNQPQAPQYPPIQPQGPQPVQFQPQQVTQPVYQQPAAFPQQMPSPSSKKPLLIIGIVVAVVAVLGGVTFAVLGGKKGGSLPGAGIVNKVAGGGIQLKDYTSQGAKFQMKLPDGTEITDEKNPYDQNLHSVRTYGPQREDYDSSKDIGRSVGVTYEHQTDAARHKTSYADYLKNAKEDASSRVRHSDESSQTVMDKEEETTVAGHKAYIAQTTTTDATDGSRSVKKAVYIYIDELTVYNMEFETDASDAAFINQIDVMIKSFKTL